MPLLENPRHVVLDLYIRDQNRELIAPEPRQEFRIRSETQAARGDLLQQRITVLATQRVIDGVKALEIQEDKRKRVLGPGRRIDVLI